MFMMLFLLGDYMRVDHLHDLLLELLQILHQEQEQQPHAIRETRVTLAEIKALLENGIKGG